MGFIKKQFSQLKSDYKKKRERDKEVRAIEQEAYEKEREKQAALSGAARAKAAGQAKRTATFQRFQQFAKSVPAGAPRSVGLTSAVAPVGTRKKRTKKSKKAKRRAKRVVKGTTGGSSRNFSDELSRMI